MTDTGRATFSIFQAETVSLGHTPSARSLLVRRRRSQPEAECPSPWSPMWGLECWQRYSLLEGPPGVFAERKVAMFTSQNTELAGSAVHCPLSHTAGSLLSQSRGDPNPSTGFLEGPSNLLYLICHQAGCPGPLEPPEAESW